MPRVFSEAHRAALRRGAANRSPGTRFSLARWVQENGSPMKGKTLPPEARAKISKANTGRIHIRSEEAKKNLSESLKRYWAAHPERRKALQEECSQRWHDLSDGWGTGQAKRIPHGGVVMRSSWEVQFASTLGELGIRWEYEPRFFQLRGSRYTPDFYLPDLDLYVEVKPEVFFSRNQHKIEQMKEIYDIDVVMLDLADFEGFLQEVAA